MIEPFGESHGLVALAKFRAHGPDMVTGTSRRTAQATSRLTRAVTSTRRSRAQCSCAVPEGALGADSGVHDDERKS